MPHFVFRQGSGIFGAMLGFFGLLVGISAVADSGQLGPEYAVAGGIFIAMGLSGIWMVYQSRTFTFGESGFELSHFGRVTKVNYSEITDAKELVYRGRGDYVALGYCLKTRIPDRTFSFKVAARGTTKSSDFMHFMKQKMKPDDYHDCDENDPDYIRTLWW